MCGLRKWPNRLVLGEYTTFKWSTNVMRRIFFKWILLGGLRWPIDVQGASLAGCCINRHWLCPPRTTRHLYACQQIRKLDAKRNEQQAIATASCSTKCDLTVILRFKSQLNIFKQKRLFTFLKQLASPLAPFVIKLPARFWVSAAICKLQWQLATLATPIIISCS